MNTKKVVNDIIASLVCCIVYYILTYVPRIFDLSTTAAKSFAEFTPVLVLIVAGLCVSALIKLGKQDRSGK